MKGTIVFDGMNDVVFVAADEEFTAYVNKQGRETGLIEPEAVETHTIDPNVAVQLFSPLAASQRFMVAQLKNPYSSVRCENGFLFVFKQFGDQLHLAVNGDGTESEDFLNRKLSVFQKLNGVLYGPVSEEIKPENSQERRQRHRFLRCLLNTWVDLYREEQSFLMEAVERLNVTQVVNESCIKSLETVMEKMTSAGDKHVQHALLLVNSKLLALYSSRNAVELQPSDVLAIIVLVQSMLPSEEKLEDLFSYSCRQRRYSDTDKNFGVIYIPQRERYDSALEGDDEDSSEEVEYYSPCTTPVKEEVEDSDSPGESQNTQSNTELSGSASPYPKVSMQGSEDYYFTPRETESNTEAANPLVGGAAAAQPLPISPRASPLEHPDYQRLPVFLNNPGCPYTPHILHCVKVLPGMVLVIVSQSSRASHSATLCRTMNLLKEVLAGNSSAVLREHGGELYEALETNMAKVIGLLKKLPWDRLQKDVRQRWADCKRNNIDLYMEQNAKDEISSKLEAPLRNLTTKICDLFRLLYLSPRPPTDAIQKAVLDSKEVLVHHFKDYKEYLAVKAQRNVTMTTYLEDYPGLVHFIYVDRTSNQITAPSINIASDEQRSQHDATQLLKDKVWQRCSWIQSKLSQGYTTLTVRDGDFHFGYFLWFEDSAGNPLTYQQPFKPESVSVQPGVIAGNFYDQLIRSCFPDGIVGGIHCFELVTMHVGVVPTQYVVSHCRKLASQLWEAFTISLL
ncbi:BLOC-3 complex member HPS1-like [Liolophura sinensis]|uniref:BLOC-3 complex member HPS1-like n=1 Tax=Liolophura sinensis TaxID=3198878 RepID=UPI0031598BD4